MLIIIESVWTRIAENERKTDQKIINISAPKNKYAISPLITNGVGLTENR